MGHLTVPESGPVDVPRIARLLARAAIDARPFDPCALDARDPEVIEACLPLFESYARRYVKLEIDGAEHLATPRALFVGNHNGGIFGPDLLCTLGCLWRALGPRSPVYALAHDLAMRRVLPLGRVLAKLGALRAHPDNAHRALAAGAPVLVYPGGELDAYRPFWLRNRIVFGARTGFARIAQRERAPIVPIVAEGAHRSAIIFHEGEWIARSLGLTEWSRIERFPLALALPWGIGAGPWVPYLPLPFRIRLRVLAPIEVAPSDEPALVRDHVVRSMQTALDELVAR